MISQIFKTLKRLNMFNISQVTSPYRSKLIIKSYKSWLKEGQSVLDIGCGTGITTKAIMDNFNVKVIGCDVENYLVFEMPFHKISKKGKLPFKNNDFDLAMLNDVLHHVDKEHQTSIIKEALRVAKKVLIFEAKPTISAKVFDTILNKFHYSSLDAPLTFRSSEEWEELFDLMKIEYIMKNNIPRPFWYPFSHIAILIKNK